MKCKRLIVCIVPLVLLLVPVLGFSADKTAALQNLYEAAKKEGKIVVHTGSTLDKFTPVAGVFKKRYPGIKVELIAQPSPSVATRIITEASAGKITIDVAKGEVEYYTNELLARNLIRKIDLSDVIDVDPANIFLDGRLHQEDNKVTVIGYSTSLVSKADVPQTWEDLLDPKWKGGKLFFTQFGLAPSSLFDAWGESRAIRYLKKLNEQGLVITRSPRPGADKVANSEAHLSATFANSLYMHVVNGAPVAFTPIGPQMVLVAGTYAMENSPHPNAAKLWIAWKQSPEARAAIWKYMKTSTVHKPENSPLAKLIHDAGIKLWYVSTPEIAKARGGYGEKIKEIFGVTKKK